MSLAFYLDLKKQSDRVREELYDQATRRAARRAAAQLPARPACVVPSAFEPRDLSGRGLAFKATCAKAADQAARDESDAAVAAILAGLDLAAGRASIETTDPVALAVLAACRAARAL